MFRTIDLALIDIIKKNLSSKIPSDNITVGTFSSEFPSVSLLLSEFTLEEGGIGGSTHTKYEQISEIFDSDGKSTEFHLKEQPLRPLISLECPPGFVISEPDEYTTDYTAGIITIRKPPEKKKDALVAIYNRARSVGVVIALQIKARYLISVRSKDPEERNLIIREIITAFLLNNEVLEKQGITLVQFIEGYTKSDVEGNQLSEIILEYQVHSTLAIEIPGAPMDRMIIQQR